MLVYFAFGSNMSSARLRARIGGVEDLGRAVLSAHRHRFSKLGADGTGKGNIEPYDGSTVHGVAYRLSRSQWNGLAEYEGGYRSRGIVLALPCGSTLAALTFAAAVLNESMPPTDAYLEHYRVGLDEHGIDPAYRARILGDT